MAARVAHSKPIGFSMGFSHGFPPVLPVSDVDSKILSIHKGYVRVKLRLLVLTEGAASDTWHFFGYPLVNIQKTMENHHFQWKNPV